MIKKNNKNILKTISLLIIYELIFIILFISTFIGIIEYERILTTFFIAGISFVSLSTITFTILNTYNLFHFIKYYFLKDYLLEIKKDKIIINLPMIYNVEILKKDIESTSISVDRKTLAITVKDETKISNNKLFLYLAEAITNTISYQEYKISFSVKFLENNDKIKDFLDLDQSYTKYLDFTNKYLKENKIKDEKELYSNKEHSIKYVKYLYDNVLNSRNKISFFTNIEYNKICKYINK